MRLFALVTDAFGGRGGIAKFNRDLLAALCAHPACREVVAVPRLLHEAPGPLPARLTFPTAAAQGKLRYGWTVLQHLLRKRYDAVVCGHIHLLPLAYFAARLQSAPLLLVVHGLEARQPTGRLLTDRLAARVDAFAAVSAFTKRQFTGWTGLPLARGTVVPNCIDQGAYGPGPKPRALIERYGLEGRRVLLTLSRLPVQDLRKGHDEVLGVLPALAEDIPDAAYLIAGDGPDRARLERKVHTMGLGDRVVFAGYVPEDEKADHFRLADAFVMPGYTEGFGIVYLEALACGVPVVASSADASQEAVRGGELGIVVDPDNPAALKEGIRHALAAPRGVPDGLDYFSTERFRQRWHALLDRYFGAESPAVQSHPAPTHPLAK